MELKKRARRIIESRDRITKWTIGERGALILHQLAQRVDGCAGHREQQACNERERDTLLAGEVGRERAEDVVVQLDGPGFVPARVARRERVEALRTMSNMLKARADADVRRIKMMRRSVDVHVRDRSGPSRSIAREHVAVAVDGDYGRPVGIVEVRPTQSACCSAASCRGLCRQRRACARSGARVGMANGTDVSANLASGVPPRYARTISDGERSQSFGPTILCGVVSTCSGVMRETSSRFCHSALTCARKGNAAIGSGVSGTRSLKNATRKRPTTATGSRRE